MISDTYYIRSKRGMRVARVHVERDDEHEEVHHMDLLMSDGSALAGWALPRPSIYTVPALREYVAEIGWTLEGPVSE